MKRVPSTIDPPLFSSEEEVGKRSKKRKNEEITPDINPKSISYFIFSYSNKTRRGNCNG